MKWLFYVVVCVYMFYRAVYGVEIGKKDRVLEVLPISYPEGLGYLPSGSRLTVTCKLNNRNQKVDWLDPNGEVIKHDTTNRLYSHRRIAPSSAKGSPFLLTFTHAVVEDTGVYTCQSDHVREDVTLCVIDPARFVDTSREEVVDEGRSYTLSCEARGDPQPELIWSKDGEEIDSDDKLNSKYKIFQKFNHAGFESLFTITSVAPEDGGTYECRAVQKNVLLEECSLVDSINITLQVNYKPVFENDGEPTYVFANLNETVNLDCSANAFPKASYRWFHDEGENQLKEYTTKQIKLLEDDTVARLTLFVDSNSFGQKFTCTATNDLGETLQDFILAKLEKPEAPIEVSVAQSLAHELVFNFTFDEGNPPFDVIEAQYKISDDSERRPRETEWRRGKVAELQTVEDEKDHYKLLHLEPERSYWVRFRTANDIGYSGWSQPHSVSTRSEEEEASTEETTTEAVTEDDEALAKAESDRNDSMNDATFYGIFFAGGIFVLAFVCMFAMRMV